MTGIDSLALYRVPLHAGDVRAPADVFGDIYTVFLWLGTLVGVVVITYTLYNAYKYRASKETEKEYDVERPQQGEIPTGGGGGRKLFVSFGISAIIVLSLIIWTYSALLHVETQPQQAENALEIDVIGHQFSWEFVYPNGESRTGTLRVPQNRTVILNVTSADVFHNFGIPEFRTKTDAIPGQTTTTWFVGKETGTYAAHCYELCGSGHSYMDAEVVVMPRDEWQQWYSDMNTSETETNATESITTGETA
ncbi:MAG: cytochrome c oxidase subunit II [Haloarculaceae archaeon]